MPASIHGERRRAEPAKPVLRGNYCLALERSPEGDHRPQCHSQRRPPAFSRHWTDGPAADIDHVAGPGPHLLATSSFCWPRAIQAHTRPRTSYPDGTVPTIQLPRRSPNHSGVTAQRAPASTHTRRHDHGGEKAKQQNTTVHLSAIVNHRPSRSQTRTCVSAGGFNPSASANARQIAFPLRRVVPAIRCHDRRRIGVAGAVQPGPLFHPGAASRPRPPPVARTVCRHRRHGWGRDPWRPCSHPLALHKTTATGQPIAQPDSQPPAPLATRRRPCRDPSHRLVILARWEWEAALEPLLASLLHFSPCPPRLAWLPSLPSRILPLPPLLLCLWLFCQTPVVDGTTPSSISLCARSFGGSR